MRLIPKSHRNLISPIFYFLSLAPYVPNICNITGDTKQEETVNLSNRNDSGQTFPRFFVSTFKHRTFRLSCLCALLSDTSSHGFLPICFLLSCFSSSRKREDECYTFPKISLSDIVCLVCACVACVHESLHYIFISVNRAFAGYLRQIVRLSGFAVPIFLKRGCSGKILLDSATRRKIVLYDIVYTECITACKINHIIDIAVICQLNDNSRFITTRSRSWNKEEFHVPQRIVLVQT